MFDKDMVCHYTSKDKAISILNDKQINFSPLVMGSSLLLTHARQNNGWPHFRV